MLSASIRTMKFKQIPDTGVLLWLLSVVVPPTFFNNTKTNFGWLFCNVRGMLRIWAVQQRKKTASTQVFSYRIQVMISPRLIKDV